MGLEYKSTLYVDSYSELINLPQSTVPVGQRAMERGTYNEYVYDGTAWMPLARFVIKKGTVIVDGKTAKSTLIYTLEPVPLSFFPAQIILRTVSVLGASLKPTISVGTNSPDYDNIASGSLLNSVTNLLGITSAPQNVTTSPQLVGGTPIYIKVSTGAIATSYTFKVDIAGYYEIAS